MTDQVRLMFGLKLRVDLIDEDLTMFGQARFFAQKFAPRFCWILLVYLIIVWNLCFVGIYHCWYITDEIYVLFMVWLVCSDSIDSIDPEANPYVIWLVVQ